MQNTSLTFDIVESDIDHLSECIACGSTDFTKISECEFENGLTFFSTSICDKCAHVFRDIKPSEGWFNKGFRNRHDYQSASGIQPLNPKIEEQRYARYLAIAKYIKTKSDQPMTVMDVGCGPGTGLNAFRDLGFEVQGIEPDESRSSIGVKEHGLKIYQGEFQTYSSEEKFDVIMFNHALEHFHNPEYFLNKIKDIAHKDTLLYIEVPEVLDHVIDWNDSLYLAHLSNFNSHSLEEVALKSGWHLVERAHPYTNTDLHKNHLCMIFSLKDRDVSNRAAFTEEVKSRLKSDIKKSYYNNLLDANVGREVKFVLKEINDLSLAYKAINVLEKNVHDNYENRALTHVGDNKFTIT